MNYFEKVTSADRRFIKLGNHAIERLKKVCDDLADKKKNERKS